MLQQGVAYDVALDATWSLPVVDLVPAVLSDLQEVRFSQFLTTPWPDDGVNRGRAVCCLFSTLLC